MDESEHWRGTSCVRTYSPIPAAFAWGSARSYQCQIAGKICAGNGQRNQKGEYSGTDGIGYYSTVSLTEGPEERIDAG